MYGGRALTDDEITGLLIATLFAGQHTSSITSAWTGYFMIANQVRQLLTYVCPLKYYVCLIKLRIKHTKRGSVHRTEDLLLSPQMSPYDHVLDLSGYSSFAVGRCSPIQRMCAARKCCGGGRGGAVAHAGETPLAEST